MENPSGGESVLETAKAELERLARELPSAPDGPGKERIRNRIAGLAALVIAGGVWRAKRQVVEWDDSAMTGPATGGRPLAFSDVAAVDRSRWEKKGILVVHAKDGRKVTLDAWHHSGVKELAEKLPAGSTEQ